MNNRASTGNLILKIASIAAFVMAGILVISMIALIAVVGSYFGGYGTGIIVASCIFGFILAALYVIAGIFGVKYGSDPQKINLCIVFGIIVGVVSLICLIIAPSWYYILAFLVGIAYCVGAFMVKTGSGVPQFQQGYGYMPPQGPVPPQQPNYNVPQQGYVQPQAPVAPQQPQQPVYTAPQAPIPQAPVAPPQQQGQTPPQGPVPPQQ